MLTAATVLAWALWALSIRTTAMLQFTRPDSGPANPAMVPWYPDETPRRQLTLTLSQGVLMVSRQRGELGWYSPVPTAEEIENARKTDGKATCSGYVFLDVGVHSYDLFEIKRDGFQLSARLSNVRTNPWRWILWPWGRYCRLLSIDQWAWGASGPVWIGPALMTALCAWRWRRRWARWKRLRAGQCLRCGYDRARLAAGTPCPECGTF